ncbi:MAG: ROK family protein [Oscillospiraceae bacterium]|nr:ROK family protein [Oscillospiraceae bacterium]
MSAEYIVGIDAGGTKVAYGLFDGSGALVARAQHPTDAGADGPAFSDDLVAGVQDLLRRGGLDTGDLAGVGMCMPSYILYDTGRILMTSAIPRIKDFDMLDYLRGRLPSHVRVVLDNDANAAAIAEHRRGAGRGARHMVYVVVGTGLGSGIIIDGKLFHGSYGWAGECGHMLATPGDGILCGCENRGCFMSHTAGMALGERVRLKLGGAAGDAVGAGDAACITGAGGAGGCAESVLAGGAVDGQTLLKAYNDGDAWAADIIGDMAHYLAVCLYNIYQMLNIDTFVFGGGLVNLGEPLFSRVRAAFDMYDHIRVPVHFKMAELTEDAGIIGAAEFARG